MPQTLGGQYHLVERVGRGGMAEAWRAISRGPAGFEKIVVIKRVLPHLARSTHFMDMLVREAKIAARLSHANIVQIFDLGVDGETYFIAMEHVDGLNLAQTLVKVGQRRMSVSLPLRLHIVAEVGKALDFAHRQRDDSDRDLGIVHRDVSPSNVLLSGRERSSSPTSASPRLAPPTCSTGRRGESEARSPTCRPSRRARRS